MTLQTNPYLSTQAQPDLLSVAEMVDRADTWWLDCATRAAREMAGRGVDFTADDLTALGVPDPDKPNRWGSLFAALKRDGLIRPVGYRASTRPGRNGGVTRVWQGAS